MINGKIHKLLNKLPRFHKDPGLSRIKVFLQENKPANDTYNIIIAGTNGKGSVGAMLENILSRAGIKAGVMRSPHIYEPAERISLNNKKIDPDIFIEILDYVNRFFNKKKEAPTLADVTTAAALVYFSKYRVPRVLLMEVGMGGRLDPVNALRKDVTVITNIGRDHTAILGEYPEGPAMAKAGIVSDEIPLFTGETNPDVLKIFRQICQSKNSPLNESMGFNPSVTGISKDGTQFKYKGKEYLAGLTGYQQAKNGALAIDIIDYMNKSGFNIGENSIKQGLKSTKLPWRMELFSETPLIYFDGAHNREGWQNLRKTLECMCYDNLNILFFTLKRKKIEDFPPDFPGKTVNLFLPYLKNMKFAKPGGIQEKNCNFKGTMIKCKGLKQAVKKTLAATGKNDITLVTGTFSLAGIVKDVMGEEIKGIR